MTREVCDLCGKVIKVGVEPTYGAMAPPDKPHLGAKLGDARHYECHVAKYGKDPDVRQGFSDFKKSLAELKGRLAEVLAPGGTLDKVRDALAQNQDDEQGAPAPSSRPQGPCRYCGQYWFKHPTKTCPTHFPAVQEY